jgi:DNA processing protein
MDEKAYWVGFNHIKGIGAVRLQALLSHFERLENAWGASKAALRAAGLSERLAESVVRLRSDLDPEKLYENILKKSIRVVTWMDETYPRRLKEIEQPPPTLYVKGSFLLEDEWSISIVGTRRVTAYGRQATEELATYLAQNHITIVSGLARGVDGAAHQAALKSGGRTFAVLGSGVDIIYPPENRLLAEKVASNGAIISDYPPGTPPDAANFPARNRIISGLSIATIVVEAGIKSGALITAEFAVEQGRDVFAVPGNIHAPQSEGTNFLIQQGARPLLRPKEVLDTLNLQQIQEHRAMRELLPVDDVEAALIKILSQEPMHIDEIHQQSGLPISQVSATLAMLELKGLVNHVGGMHYTAVRDDNAEYRI